MEKQVVDGLREVFQSGRSRPLQYRKQQLGALHRLITEHQEDIEQALKQDLNRVRQPFDRFLKSYKILIQ